MNRVLALENDHLSKWTFRRNGPALLLMRLSWMSIDFFWSSFIYVFIFGCAGSSLWHMAFLSSCSKHGLLSSCDARASHCGGFSGCGALALRHVSFNSCGSWALEHRLSHCGLNSCDLVAPWNWDPLRPGIKPASPTLAGRFFITEPPGKPQMPIDSSNETSFSGTNSFAISETGKISHPSWTGKISESLGTSCLYSSPKPEARSFRRLAWTYCSFSDAVYSGMLQSWACLLWKSKYSTSILEPKPCQWCSGSSFKLI